MKAVNSNVSLTAKIPKFPQKSLQFLKPCQPLQDHCPFFILFKACTLSRPYSDALSLATFEVRILFPLGRSRASPSFNHFNEFRLCREIVKRLSSLTAILPFSIMLKERAFPSLSLRKRLTSATLTFQQFLCIHGIFIYHQCIVNNNIT